MKKPITNRLFVLLLFVIGCMVVAAACSGQKLAAGFTEAEVRRAAEEIITMINEQDSDALREISTVQLRNALTDDLLAEIFEAIGEGGAFIGIQDLNISGSTDQSSGEAYAVVIVKSEYEIKRFIYTITFTRQMKLAGLYYR